MMVNNHKYKKLQLCNQNANDYTTDELPPSDQLLPKHLVSVSGCFFFFVHTLKQDFSFPVTKKEIPEQPAMTNAMVNLLLEDNV